jgi:hypothetical protein
MNLELSGVVALYFLRREICDFAPASSRVDHCSARSQIAWDLLRDDC